MEKDIFVTRGYSYSLEKAHKITVGKFVRFFSSMGALKLMISRNVLFSGILTSVFSWSEEKCLWERNLTGPFPMHQVGQEASSCKKEQAQKRREEQKRGPVCCSRPPGQPPGLRV